MVATKKKEDPRCYYIYFSAAHNTHMLCYKTRVSSPAWLKNKPSSTIWEDADHMYFSPWLFSWPFDKTIMNLILHVSKDNIKLRMLWWGENMITWWENSMCSLRQGTEHKLFFLLSQMINSLESHHAAHIIFRFLRFVWFTTKVAKLL